MRLGLRLASAIALLGVAATPRATRPPPVFEIHRTAAAAHLHAGGTDPIFALVIGSDIREGDPNTGRADSIHIVALNRRTLRGTVLGIPRDAYVPVAGFGRMKLSESLYHGGAELTVRAVQEATGIPIHYWAITEFSRFRLLVDRLGGVEMDIPYPMADPFSGAFFEQGRRLLNGAEALAFSRNRYGVPDGDLSRSANQGALLLAGLAKLRAEATDPFGVLRYVDAFRELVVSNMPMKDVLVLASIARRTDPANLRNVVAPVRLGIVGGASVAFLEAPAAQMFAAVRDDGEL